MATSGISSFNLDLNELFEEAFERCGKQMRSGYDFRTARRSMNILTIEWLNRGINLWTIEQDQIPLNTGQSIYALPLDTLDILDAVTRQYNGQIVNQIDINVTRISESTYAFIPNKNAYGRPLQMWVNRSTGNLSSIPQTTLAQAAASTDTTITLTSAANLPTTGFVQIDSEIIAYQNLVGNQILNAWRGQANTTAAAHLSGASVFNYQLPCVNLWPTPNAPGDQYTFVYYRMRRMQDAGNGSTTQDIPFRWIPPMVAGMAYYLSEKLEDVDPGRRAELKANYEQQFQLAADEDREKATDRFVPRSLWYYR